MKKILIVVGTRPNFIKVTRFRKVAEKHPELELRFLHTGQHFDRKMSEVFFEQFGLRPDYNLGIGQGTPVAQMAATMQGIENVCNDYKPDLLMVVGDVNSTLAGAITANKLGIRLAHLESGLRSFDRSMPEEINRILTDEITDYYFVTEQSGLDNLEKEGRNMSRAYFVGNTMIDSLEEFRPEIERNEILEQLGLIKKEFALMTMHRPANVDTREGLVILGKMISTVLETCPLVFPAHPRTVERLKSNNIIDDMQSLKDLIFCEPLDYFSFQKLVSSCRFVVTDSGGIQEETTYRQIPCLTLRNSTERPSTVELGSNELVPYEPEELKKMIRKIEEGVYKKGNIPPLWDGKSTERVLDILGRLLTVGHH